MRYSRLQIRAITLSSTLLIVGLTGLRPSLAGTSGSTPPPGVIYGRSPELSYNVPLWISVDELAARGERFETTALLDSTRDLASFSREIQRQRLEQSLSDSSCPISRGFSAFERMDGRSVHDIRAVTSSSRAIAIGEIADTTAGFMLGVPNTLITLQTISILTNPSGMEVPSTLYVPFHQANFSFDGFSFCAESSYGKRRYIPQEGDRIIVFLLDQPTEDLVLAHPHQIVVLPRDSRKPLLPQNLIRSMGNETISQEELLVLIESKPAATE